MKVALVVPPAPSALASPYGRRSQALLHEDIGLGLMAAVLEREGHGAQLLHCPLQGQDGGQAAAWLAEEAPDLIILSLAHASEAISGHMALLNALRETDYRGHVTTQGFLTAMYYEDLLRACPRLDSVAFGETEETIPDLLDALARGDDWRATPGLVYRNGDGVARSSARPLIPDLDQLPWPRRDVLAQRCAQEPMAAQTAVIEGSRGCPNQCAFCAVRTFFGSQRPFWRGRSPQNLLAEMTHLHETYNVQRFEFCDSNFIGPAAAGRQRALDFAHRLAASGARCTFSILCRAETLCDRELMIALMQSGLRQVSIGIESGSQQVLDRYHKGATVDANRRALQAATELGLACSLQLIAFDPYTTLDELEETVRFVRETGAQRMVKTPRRLVNQWMPFPGTPLWERYRREKSGALSSSLVQQPNAFLPFRRYYLYSDPGVEIVWQAMQHLLQQIEHQQQTNPGEVWQAHLGELVLDSFEAFIANVKHRTNTPLKTVLATLVSNYNQRYLDGTAAPPRPGQAL